MGTLTAGIKEIFSAAKTSGSNVMLCGNDGTPDGHMTMANLASVLGDIFIDSYEKSVVISSQEYKVVYSSSDFSRGRSIGLIEVRDNASDVICLFAANNGNVNLLSVYFTITTNIKDTPNKVNIYMENGNLIFQNLTSINRTFNFHRFI